jgi:phage shock protein PspC (stress-responsive transcriptional regulator)
MCGESGKVTIVELLWVTLLIGGAAAGAMIGRAQFGVWGGAIGLPVGFGVGLLLCCVIAYLLNLIMRPKSPAERERGRR